MRYFLGFLFVVLALAATPQANATPVVSCVICTCENNAVICLDGGPGEIIEEQGICAGPCADVDSTFESREIVETACGDLPTCAHAETPTASPLWLSAGMIGLLFFGAATLRRVAGRAEH